MTPDDAELLRRYVREEAKDAFGELVRRHLGVVYHAALRQVGGDAHRAEDVAQEVFTLLARKAPGLLEHTMLIGWLFSTTRNVAWRVVRSEHRRRRREEEAWTLSEVGAGAKEDNWERLRPLLDEELNRLKPAERDALLLRYFQEQPLAEVGRRFAVSEDAARMRVDRALEKLRTRLVKRGIGSTAGALAVLLASNAVGATPGGLATNVTAGALGQAAAGGGVVATLTKLVLMTKTQMAVLGGVLACLVAGVAWQTQQGLELERRLASERKHGVELAAERQRIELEMAQAQVARTQAVAPSLTPEEQERKRQRILTSRKTFDPQFAALYRRLRLPPAELEKLKDLLAEREWEQSFEHWYAFQNGLGEMRGNESERIRAAATLETNGRIRELLGEANYVYFVRYDRSTFMRNSFSQLSDELEYLGVPMSDEQMDQFTDLAFIHMREDPDKWREGRGRIISDEMLEKAAGFLRPEQLARVKVEQEVLAAREKIDAMNRAAAEEGRVTVNKQYAKFYPKCPVK